MSQGRTAEFLLDDPLPLLIGCGDYDRTRALFTGQVAVEGIDLTWEPVLVPHQLFVRVLRGEFDAAEMSMSGLTAHIAGGGTDLIGLPVFTSRLFRHSFIFINAEAGIREASDLIGRRVGVPDYTITAALWIRGLLQHDYGVAPEQVKWFLGSLDRPGQEVPLANRPQRELHIEPIPTGTSLGAMLEEGQLDAIICASNPAVFTNGSPRVRRLFPNYAEVEADYYHRTGIIPIMHTVVMRKRVYEAHPWIARRLYDAFNQSKSACFERLIATGAPAASLTWLQSYLDHEREVFGPDPWPYGLAANRPTLEALVAYSYEQGLSPRLLKPEDLFAAETLDT